VISRRVSLASDGDLFWLMNNGVPWKGMPPWMMLPEKERWQLVTYLRSLNEIPLAAAYGNATPSQLKGASR
jgi:mono/diheme cytochrome c family protein